MTVSGTVDPRFEGLREAFASCFADELEYGGAVSVAVDGRIVADLWGGTADAAGATPWRADTLVNVWSVTKGVVALAVAMLVEQGKLDYAKPVAAVWPEFAAGGKAAITLDLVMSHRAGLNGVDVTLSDEQVLAWTPYADALAAMAPLWEPGSRCVYHMLSYGHLAGEPIRRVTGGSVGNFIAEAIAGPLGVDFFVGLPDAQDHRAARMTEGPLVNAAMEQLALGPYWHSVRNPTPTASAPNYRAWRAAEVPGGNGQATARALATIYGALAQGGAWNGVRLISPAGLSAATALRVRGEDASFLLPTAYGAGFRLEDPHYGPNAAVAFGHSGWGGSYTFADPVARVGFAYVTSYMRDFDDGIDLRRKRLVEAVYAALGD
jgi:CubicO group peptidase (beta-lactamase class C family)